MPEPSPFPPGSKVFAYLRDSGHSDQELSIPQQEGQIRQYALDHQLILTRLYIDAAKKGGAAHTDKRLALHQMLHDIRRGCPEAGVIVWKFSRFARSQDHAQLYRAEIRSHGKIFYSLRDKIPEGPFGRLFEAFIDYKDEQFIQDMSIDIQRALRDNLLLNGCVPGTPPFGFVRQPVTLSLHRDGTPRTASKWVPDPKKISLVQQAFQLRAAGASLNAILTATHGQISVSKNSYRTFFANQLYRGVLVYGDLTVENYCEPLIDPATWEAVQARQGYFTRRTHLAAHTPAHPRRANSRYLLSGLAFCALCGSPLSGHTSPQSNGLPPAEAYICSRSIRNPGQCVRARMPRHVLEPKIFELLTEHILQPEMMQAAYLINHEREQTRLSELQAQRLELTQQIATTRRQLGNLANAIAETGHTKTLLTSLATYETRETELITALTTLDEQLRATVREIPPDELIPHLANLTQLLQSDQVTPDEKRLILRGLIQKITLQRTGQTLFGEITFYYPPPPISPADSDDSAPQGYNSCAASSPSVLAVSTMRVPPEAQHYRHSLGFLIRIPYPKRKRA